MSLKDTILVGFKWPSNNIVHLSSPSVAQWLPLAVSYWTAPLGVGDVPPPWKPSFRIPPEEAVSDEQSLASDSQ